MAGRGEPECRQLLLETVRIVPEGAWCGGTDGLWRAGTCAECEGDATDPYRLRASPRLYVRRDKVPFLSGANPARQLSLQPVAVGADDGGNDIG